jgi:hypothetical protein
LKTIYRKKFLQKLVTEGADLLILWKKMTVLDVVYEISATWNLIKVTTLKKSLRKILRGNDAEFLDINNNLNEAVSETLINLRQITGCENLDKEAIREWLKADENLTGYEILSDDEMVC